MALQITDANVQEILESDKLVIIDFWAEWCGPCKQIAPIVEELSQEFADKAIIGKYNVDDENDFATDQSIRNIPTLLFFKNGKLIEKQVGATSKSTLQEKILKLL